MKQANEKLIVLGIYYQNRVHSHLLLVSELWMLVLEAQSNPQWAINIVLFSEPGHLDTLLTRLSYGQQHKPIDLEIDENALSSWEHPPQKTQ